MEFIEYIRKPFKVEAIEITVENMAEVAKLVGEVRTKSDVTYIALDRRIVPNVNKAFVGWYMTRLGDNYRCYSPKVFTDQFAVHEPNTGYFFEDEDAEPSLTEPGEVERLELNSFDVT